LNERAPGALYQRLLWFLAIWAASVAGLGVVALILRWLLKP